MTHVTVAQTVESILEFMEVLCHNLSVSSYAFRYRAHACNLPLSFHFKIFNYKIVVMPVETVCEVGI